MTPAQRSLDDALLRILRSNGGAPVEFRHPPEPLAGGFYAAIFGFELKPDDSGHAPGPLDGPLVLRIMPEATVARKEIIVQTELSARGFSTPDVVRSGHDDELGGAFMIMRRVDGRSPMSGLDLGGSPIGLIRSLRSIPHSLATVAAQLHAIDPATVDAALRADDIHLGELGDASYRRDIVEATMVTTTSTTTGFAELLRWFDDHRPDATDRVVCHGDLHPLNLLVDGDGTINVIDWTNANVCPRELDVGFTTAFLRCAPISVPERARPVVRRVTNHLAKRFLRLYRAQPGARPLDPERLRWYEALQYARCLAEVAIGRIDPTAVVGPSHPFETASRDMTRELARLTGIAVALPVRRPPDTPR